MYDEANAKRGYVDRPVGNYFSGLEIVQNRLRELAEPGMNQNMGEKSEKLKRQNDEHLLELTRIIRDIRRELKQDIEIRKNIWFHINIIHISLCIIAITIIIMNILMFKK